MNMFVGFNGADIGNLIKSEMFRDKKHTSPENDAVFFKNNKMKGPDADHPVYPVQHKSHCKNKQGIVITAESPRDNSAYDNDREGEPSFNMIETKPCEMIC